MYIYSSGSWSVSFVPFQQLETVMSLNSSLMTLNLGSDLG